MPGDESQGQSMRPVGSCRSRGGNADMQCTSEAAYARARGQAMVMEVDPKEEVELGPASSYPRRTTANYGPLPPCQLGEDEDSDKWSWASQADDEDDDGGHGSKGGDDEGGGRGTAQKRKASRFTGVTFRKNRRSKPWQAKISLHGHCKHLGNYETEEKAAEVFRKAAEERAKSMPEKCSQYRGVHFYTKNTRARPWRAKIKYGGKSKHLGNFGTEREAALAYDEAAKKYHKEAAILNFPANQDDGGGQMKRAGERGSYHEDGDGVEDDVSTLSGDSDDDGDNDDEKPYISSRRCPISPQKATRHVRRPNGEEGGGLGGDGGRQERSKDKPSRSIEIKQEEGCFELEGSQYRRNDEGERANALSGRVDGASGRGMIVTSEPSATPSNEPFPSPLSISHHGEKEGDHGKASEGGGGRDGIRQSTSPQVTFSASSSSSSDDDDDSVVVVDPPIRSASRQGFGAATTVQTKRRREGEDRHGGGKKSVESPVLSPARKVMRGQEGPSGSHDSQKEEVEDQATDVVDRDGGSGDGAAGRDVRGAASSAPSSSGPSSSHASAMATTTSMPQQSTPTPPDIQEMRERAMGLLFHKMRELSTTQEAPQRIHRLSKAVDSVGKGEGDDMLRAALIHAKMDMEDDVNKEMLVGALLARFA